MTSRFTTLFPPLCIFCWRAISLKFPHSYYLLQIRISDLHFLCCYQTSMGKRKGRPDEDAAQVLEIVSIGTIYRGPWDKKYWSCSRGKDRHPYPVGYCAVRIHSGNTYRMEIREGRNGPLFVVSSSEDGISCSGHTPNTVWDNYKKKRNSPRVPSMVNNPRGGRLSGDLDANELFGFKIFSVQRLFRQLVAGLNEATDQCLSQETSYLNTKKPHYPSEPTLLSLDSKLIKNGRSLDHILISQKPDFYASTDLENQNFQIDELVLLESVDKTCVLTKDSTKFPVLKKYVNVADEDKSLHKDDLHIEPKIHGWLTEEHAMPGEQVKFVDNDSLCLSSMDKLERPSEADVEGRVSRKTEDMDVEIKVSKLCNTNLDFCFPDPLDCIKEKIYPVVSTQDESEGLEESQPVHDALYGSFIASSQRSSLHSAGQDLASSMIMLLLPRAVPLLKTYKRRRKRGQVRETKRDSSLCSNGSFHEGINVADISAKESEHGRDEKIHCRTQTLKEQHNGENVDKFIANEPCTKLQNMKDVNSVIPDSFDDGIAIGSCSNEENRNMMVTGPCSSSSPRKDNAFVLGSVICGSKIDYNTVAVSDSKELNIANKLCTGHQRREDVKSIIPDSFDDDNANGWCSIQDVGNKVITDPCSTPSPKKDDDYLLGSSIRQNIIDNNTGSVSDSKELNIAQVGQASSKSEIVERLSFACEVAEHEGLLPDVDSVLSNKPTVHVPDIMEQAPKKHFFGVNNDSAREPITDHNVDFLFKSVVNTCRKNFICISCREGLTDCCSSDDAKGNKSHRNLELKGRYIHQDPVLSVFFISVEGGLQICVFSGLMECNDRNVFIYKVSFDKQNTECPLFLGYTSISFPVIQNPFNGKIKHETCGLQFSLDGQFLILFNGVKMPCCSDQNPHCLCSVCTSVCFEENGIRIVCVKFGYVSIVKNLITAKRVCFILVCLGNHIVAIEESGKLHVWTMNTDWSLTLEESFLPGLPHLTLELKKIPNCDSIIIGHNGLGDFGLWDISKKILLVRVSCPDKSICQVIPVSLFSWREENLNNVTEEMALRSFQAEENDPTFPGEDVAVCVLVLESSNSECSHNHPVEESHMTPGRWRLALMLKKTFVFGAILDSRASALETSFQHGILGTSDGLLYLWNLFTGEKVVDLNSGCDGSISCIAADKKLNALVVACKECVLVYAHSTELC